MKYLTLPTGIDTGVFVTGENAIEELPRILKTHFPGKRPLIIADGNTWLAAGARAMELCRTSDLAPFEPIVFPAEPKPHPDYAISEKIAAETPPGCVPIAVGSGVINDLVKCACGIMKIHYCCVATAASVDGYTSAGGAMSVNGWKKTVPCPAPYAIVADTGILRTAPPEMMASGYADLMSKFTGGADWIIADELGIEKIAPDIWALVQRDLRDWLSDCRDLEKIFSGLAATGYSMQLYHESRPASGAEHLCSHVWEMEHLTFNGEEPSHGFKVGIGLLAVAQLQEFVINNPVDQVKIVAAPPLNEYERTKEISELLNRGCYGDNVAGLAMEKTPFGAAMTVRRQLIFEHWENLRRRLMQQLPPTAELREMLKKAQCPTRYREIGLTQSQYLHGIRTAQLIRKRYTVLDMLYEAGLLDIAISAIASTMDLE